MSNVNNFLNSMKENGTMEVTDEMLEAWEQAEKLDELLEDAKEMFDFEKSDKSVKWEKNNVSDEWKNLCNEIAKRRGAFLEKHGKTNLGIFVMSKSWKTIKRDLENGSTKLGLNKAKNKKGNHVYGL
jgi:hypothetical protein